MLLYLSRAAGTTQPGIRWSRVFSLSLSLLFYMLLVVLRYKDKVKKKKVLKHLLRVYTGEEEEEKKNC